MIEFIEKMICNEGKNKLPNNLETVKKDNTQETSKLEKQPKYSNYDTGPYLVQALQKK